MREEREESEVCILLNNSNNGSRFQVGSGGGFK